MRTRYVTFHKLWDKEFLLLPTLNHQIDGGVAINWLWFRVRVGGWKKPRVVQVNGRTEWHF